MDRDELRKLRDAVEGQLEKADDAWFIDTDACIQLIIDLTKYVLAVTEENTAPDPGIMMARDNIPGYPGAPKKERKA